jgi:hypothetical protein
LADRVESSPHDALTGDQIHGLAAERLEIHEPIVLGLRASAGA